MQFKLSALVAASLAASVFATGIAPGDCTTGPIQCCDSVDTAGSASVSKILALLGVVVQDVNALVGLTCTPITVIGAGGDSW
jgi:hypothetical protein